MSPLQHKIYQFIRKYLEQFGYSPTLLEIAKGVGISPKSKSLVSRYVQKLVKSDRLAFDGKGYRNINLPPPYKLQLPIEGRVAAGSPIQSIKEHKVLDLNDIFGGEESYILVVEGHSLAKDGILCGDKIICKRQSDAKEGALVVASIDKQPATVRRIHFRDDKTTELKTGDLSSSSLLYSNERVAIQAIVLGVLRVLN